MLNNRRRAYELGKDWLLISLTVGLILIGFVVKIAATDVVKIGEINLLDMSSPIGQQFVWTIIALVVFFAFLLIDFTFWSSTSFIIYGISLLLLILVLIIGSEIKGAKSWFIIGGFSFQPSELAKFGTALALANFLSNSKVSLKNTGDLIKSFLIISLPVVFIFLQPDLGSALVYSAFFFVLYREGMPPWPLQIIGYLSLVFILTLLFGVKVAMVIILTLLALFLVTALDHKIYFYGSLIILSVVNYFLIKNNFDWWALGDITIITGILLAFYVSAGKINAFLVSIVALLVAGALSFATEFAFNNLLAPHQQERINVWLHPERCDPQGSLYNVILSKMAISNGSLTGKGYLNGDLTKYNYVPEHKTDFVFCIVGEEQGFIGAFFLLVTFFVLIYRIITIGENQKTTFARSYFYAVAGILFLHVFINVGMTIGIMPVIGIPLPFISYGGSSLLSFTAMMAVLIKIDNRNI